MTPFDFTWQPWCIAENSLTLSPPDAWREPATWNAAADESGVRARVEIGVDLWDGMDLPVVDDNGSSLWNHPMSDWDEIETAISADDERDMHAIGYRRLSHGYLMRWLFRVIDFCPAIDWYVATAWPERVRDCWPNGFGVVNPAYAYRKNMHLGAVIHNQPTADARLPELLRLADLCGGLWCRYMSRGPVDLTPWLGKEARCPNHPCVNRRDKRPGSIVWAYCNACQGAGFVQGINLLTIRGDTGPDAMPGAHVWMRGAVWQAVQAGVECHVENAEPVSPKDQR